MTFLVEAFSWSNCVYIDFEKKIMLKGRWYYRARHTNWCGCSMTYDDSSSSQHIFSSSRYIRIGAQDGGAIGSTDPPQTFHQICNTTQGTSRLWRSGVCRQHKGNERQGKRDRTRIMEEFRQVLEEHHIYTTYE